MATLTTIKNRIKTTKSIVKITKVMQMISVTKYKKAKDLLACVCTLFEGYTNFLLSFFDQDLVRDYMYSLPKEKELILVVVFTNKGLCGNLNSQIFKLLKEEVINSGGNKKIKTVVIGSKMVNQIKKYYNEELEIIEAHDLYKDEVTLEDVEKFRINYLHKHNVADSIVKVFYNKYEGISKQVAEVFEPHSVCAGFLVKSLHEFVSKAAIFEEDVVELFKQTASKMLSISIFFALKNNLTCEHFSRMKITDSATKNGNELIKKVSIYYNKTRQANITKELIDLSSSFFLQN